MEENNTLIDESVTTFENALHEYEIPYVDGLVGKFNQEIAQLRQGDVLENDRIRYYLNHFSVQMYRLRTIKARESLKSMITRQVQATAYNKQLINVESKDGKKLIKEEKIAIANLNTTNEEQVAIIYKAISQAIDERIYGLDKILYNLSTMANLNMSEARLVQRGGHID